MPADYQIVPSSYMRAALGVAHVARNDFVDVGAIPNEPNLGFVWVVSVGMRPE